MIEMSQEIHKKIVKYVLFPAGYIAMLQTHFNVHSWVTFLEAVF